MQICLDGEKNLLSFRHDGRPFRVKDILAIINQVSSKNPGESIGQFGTGFMTTYQLSEKVQISSALKEKDLPYEKFMVTLNRSGRSAEELDRAIRANMDELCEADGTGEITEAQYQKEEYHTEFCYHLETPESRRIAETGMKDLRHSILYVMLFSEKLQSVELEMRHMPLQAECYGMEEAEGEPGVYRIVYERGESRELGNGLRETVILENGAAHTMRFMCEEGTWVAVEWSKEKGCLPVSDQTPKLFIDFPLVGAEEFPFPVVVNDQKLKPNEPRSGISLVDKETSESSKVNKEIMERAVRLYGRLLHELREQDRRGIVHLLYMPPIEENRERSTQWVKEHLYGQIFRYIEKEPLFETAGGWIGLSEPSLYLVRGDSIEERKGLLELCRPLKDLLVPLGEEDWYSALENYESMDSRTIGTDRLLLQAEDYMKRLDHEQLSPQEWCSLLYEQGMKNELTATEIRAGKAAIFPSQESAGAGEIRLYTVNEIYKDPGIPEILKDVSEALDELNGNTAKLTLRNRLLDLSFGAKLPEQMQEYPVSTLISYIVERSDRGFRVISYNLRARQYQNAWKKAWNLLIACGEDEKFYRLCEKAGSELPEYQPLRDERFQGNMWFHCYNSMVKELAAQLERCTSLDNAGDLLKMDEGEAADGGDTRQQIYDWLNLFYEFGSRYWNTSELYVRSIFPNQEGKLRRLQDLAKDSVQMTELKEIANAFGDREDKCRVFENLLDKGIKLASNWPCHELNDRELASRIQLQVQNVLAEGNLNNAKPQHQDACMGLSAWLQNNELQAEKYFPAFNKAEERAKLLTAGAVAQLQTKSRKLENFEEQMKELTGADDLNGILAYMKELEKLANTNRDLLDLEEEEEEQENEFSAYDSEFGVYMDEELWNMPKDLQRDKLREIGLAGERYGFQYAKSLFETGDGGWTMEQETSREVSYVRDRQSALQETNQDSGEKNWLKWKGMCRATVYYPDTGDYHQAGWDIRITLSDGEGREEVYYIEVKTHTTTSVVKNTIFLSDEQMVLAANEEDHFAVLLVDYQWHDSVVSDVKLYVNVIRAIAKRKLVNLDKLYRFRTGMLEQSDIA